MRLPSKITSYYESDLAKFPIILAELERREWSVSELFDTVKTKLNGVSEYLEILDSLYALGKVELDETKAVLFYVE